MQTVMMTVGTPLSLRCGAAAEGPTSYGRLGEASHSSPRTASAAATCVSPWRVPSSSVRNKVRAPDELMCGTVPCDHTAGPRRHKRSADTSMLITTRNASQASTFLECTRRLRVEAVPCTRLHTKRCCSLFTFGGLEKAASW